MSTKTAPATGKGPSKKLITRFRTDLEYYSQVCLSIRTKRATIERLEFNNAQRIVHRKLHEQYKREGRVRAIILKARQEGVSTYVAARYFRRLHLFPNQEALVLADKLERAKKLFGIYDKFAHLLPPEIQPMTRYVAKQTQLVLDNPDDKTRAIAPGLGSSISVETAGDPDAGRAITPNMLHLSELAFWKGAEDTMVSLMQGVPDTGSEVIIESTANGVGNHFWHMWQAAEEGTNGYMPIFLPWWIHEEYALRLSPAERNYVEESLDDLETSYVVDGIEYEGKRHKLSLEQIAWRRQTVRDKLGGDIRAFRQEYPANAEEAFLVSGDGFFDEDAIKRYELSARPPIRRGNLVRVPPGGVILRNSELGYLKVWELPREDGIYVIAADTASGKQVAARDASFADPGQERGGRDFSSADVYDCVNRRQVAQLHGRMAPEVFAEQLYQLGHYFSSKGYGGSKAPSLLGVEKNHSSGETVLSLLQNGWTKKMPGGQDIRFLPYQRLYYGKDINRRTNKRKRTLGWSTTVETRMPMLDTLAAAIRAESIGIPNKDTVKEMRTFVRGEDGKPQAQEGSHDDRVISLAIALQIARDVSLVPTQGKLPPTGTEGSSPTGLFDY